MLASGLEAEGKGMAGKTKSIASPDGLRECVCCEARTILGSVCRGPGREVWVCRDCLPGMLWSKIAAFKFVIRYFSVVVFICMPVHWLLFWGCIGTPRLVMACVGISFGLCALLFACAAGVLRLWLSSLKRQAWLSKLAA